MKKSQNFRYVRIHATKSCLPQSTLLFLTYLLTPWRRILLEKLTDFQIVKKYLAFYGTRRFITAFTSASVWRFCTMTRFYGEQFIAPSPTPKLEGQTLSAVRDCLCNIFATSLHNGGRSSSSNLRTRHAVVTGTHSSRTVITTEIKSCHTWKIFSSMRIQL